MAKRLVRKYRCQCGNEWTSIHRLGEPPLDDCPKCSVNSLPHEEGDTSPKIYGKAPFVGGSAVVKAADFTSRMLEKDYGIPPSMQVDNAREGDSYVKMPVNMPPVVTMGQGKEIVQKQLAFARGLGGMGPNNINGVDFVKNLNIPDPRKTAEFMQTKD